MTTVDPVKLGNAEEAKKAVEELWVKDHETNWLLFEYKSGSRSEVLFTSKGTDGLDGLKQQLPSSGVRFALFTITVRQQQSGETAYDPQKLLFMTWIGPQTPAGIAKARGAADGPQLADQLRAWVAIGGVVQYDSLVDLTPEDAAAKVTQQSATYTVGSSPRGQQSQSKLTASPRGATSPSAAPSRAKSAMTFDGSCKVGLEEVRSGKSTWALLGESDSKRGLVELVKCGTGGASAIAELFDPQRIFYCVHAVTISQEGVQQPIKKVVVITLVGSDVPPLAKSRSAGHRSEVLDYVLSVLPFHAHFQPLDASEVTDDAILSKCH